MIIKRLGIAIAYGAASVLLFTMGITFLNSSMSGYNGILKIAEDSLWLVASIFSFVIALGGILSAFQALLDPNFLLKI